jgi:hypothetical protein
MLASERVFEFKAFLYNKRFQPVSKSLELNENKSSGVTYDLKAEPMGHASFALLDPNRILPSHRDAIWLSRNVKLVVRELVAGQWIEVPLFFGPVQDVERDGDNLLFDCSTKDAQHLAPHRFVDSLYARKHTKYHLAIRHFMSKRGETMFQLDHVRARLEETTPGLLGVEPWKLVKKLSRHVDMFLFYRGDGRLRLKPWPSIPAFRFALGETLTEHPKQKTSVGPVRDTFVVVGQKTAKEEVKKESEMDQASAIGATSVHVKANSSFTKVLRDGMKIAIGGRKGKPETRTISGSYTSGSRTIPLVSSLNAKHGVGAPVSVTVKENVEKPVIGKATLTQNHPLSKEAQTSGDRPRVEVIERPKIHKVSKAKSVAESFRDRQAGRYERSISISTVPIWHLEVGDIYAVGGDKARIQRIFYPLNRSSMEIDWAGRRRPRR